MANSTAALSQLFLLALVLERSVAVFRIWLGDKNEAPTLTRLETFAVFMAACAILWSIPYDLLEHVFGKEPEQLAPFLGEVIGALLVAGGSAGIKQISSSMGRALRAWRVDSKLRAEESTHTG